MSDASTPDLIAQHEALSRRVFRRGACLTGERGRSLSDDEWNAGFAQYVRDLENLRELGDRLAGYVLRSAPPCEVPTNDRTPADRAAEEKCQRAALAAQGCADSIEAAADHSCSACEEPAGPVPVGLREIV